jgi:hypothetical protein
MFHITSQADWTVTFSLFIVHKGGGPNVAVLQVLLPAATALMLAGNKVLHKIALVPMASYVLLLAFTQTLSYALVYSAILGIRFW